MNRAARRAFMQVMHRRQTVAILITTCVAAISLATWTLIRLVADAPRRDAEFEFVVTTPSGHPPTRGVVAFLPDEGSTQAWRSEAVLDDHGRSVLRVRAGASGTVFVRALGLADWNSGRLAVPADGRRFDVTLASGLSVDGIVVARDGVTPVAGAEVRVADSAPNMLPGHLGLRTVRTDEQGRFRASGLREGRVRLDVFGPVGRDRGREWAVAVVDAGTRGERIQLRRTITVQFMLIDATTGRSPETDRIEILQNFDANARTRYFRSEEAVAKDSEPTPVPREPIAVWGPELARFQVLATGFAPSEEITVDPHRGPASQVVRVDLQPDRESVATLRLRVEATEGHVPSWIYVRTRSTDRRRENGRRCRVSDGVVELRVPPGPASFVVEDRTPDLPGAQRPWLPAHVAIDVPRGATMDHHVLLPTGGFVRVLGEAEHSYLPTSESAQQLADITDPERGDIDEFRVVRWEWEAATATYLSSPIPTGDYAKRWTVDGEARSLRFTVRPGEITETRVEHE